MATTRLSCSIALALSTLLIVAVPIAARAQATGTRPGSSDKIGGVMPAVTIDAINTATGLVRTAVTGADGYYSIPLLQPGTYDVRATLAGFKPVVRSRNTVSVGDTARVDVKLAVGGVEESVTVSGDSPLVETSHATLGITIDQQKVVASFPLNGRNFTQLGTLIPGVVAPPGGLGGATGDATPGGFGAATAGFNVNGMRNQSNNFLLDGASNNDTFNTGFVMRLPRMPFRSSKSRPTGTAPSWAQRGLGRERGHQVRYLTSFAAQPGSSIATMRFRRAISSRQHHSQSPS